MFFTRRLIFALTVVLLTLLTLLTLRQSSIASSTRRWNSVSQTVYQNVGWGDKEDTGFAPQRLPYQPGIAKPVGYNYTKVLVVPRTKREKVDWLYKELPDIEKVVYVADDPTAPLHPPANKGHEVMVYLTYLIDNYNHLPDVMIFMHAHRYAWHNADMFSLDAAHMVRRLSPERVTREGFLNMRCTWYPGCPDWMHPGETERNPYKMEQVLIAKAWAEIFPFDPIPEVLAQPCCSQFALSRDRALSISRDKYIEYRNWLLNTPLKDFVSGRVWEYMWQFVFTGHPTWCPAENVCYCDGFGVCFGGQEQFDAFYMIRDERDKYNTELRKWMNLEKKIKDAKARGKSTVGLEEPEPGKNIAIAMQIDACQRELNRRLQAAVERGNDPRNRALEAGREWKEGDGF